MPFNFARAGISSGRNYVIYWDEEGDTLSNIEGHRNWRNNNPGNIKYGSFAIKQGALGQDSDGFAIFPDGMTGTNAVYALITSPDYNRGQLTIREMIFKYAPRKENPTAEYERYLGKWLGVDTRVIKVNDLTAAQRDTLVDSIRKFEGGRIGTQTSVGEGGDFSTILPDGRVIHGVSAVTQGLWGDAEMVAGGEFDPLQTSSPIVLDLDGDGIETVARTEGAFFDHNGDGFREEIGWVKGNQDVLLGAANVLTGQSGNDVLDGGRGPDTMVGGLGDDTYVVADPGDVVIELAGEGVDTIQSGVAYALPANVEDLTLTGTASINGTGNALNNRLTGNLGANALNGGAGDDVLDGGSGADTLIGGTGNDRYVVAAEGDVVTELANEGTDTVESALTYALPVNVENLTLTGSAPRDGTGNSANNTLLGNSAANRLSGGPGTDTMAGGPGDDTYIVDNVADAVTEAVNEGTDAIETSVTYAHPTNVENLNLTGTGTINGTGNAVNNTLTGNGAANRLEGGAGTDTMAGGAGDDIYVVEQTADTVQEASNGGIDIVLAAVSYTLPANVENLTLTGLGVIKGTGNTLGNVLQGNGAANLLAGREGNDTYLFARGGGQDVIQDVDTTAGNRDTLAFGSDLHPLDLVISRNSNRLRLAVHGSPDRVDVQNWYGGVANQVEVIRAGDGRQLLSTQVDQLIQAMASYGVQSGLTWDQGIAARPEDVEAILAAHWQPAGA